MKKIKDTTDYAKLLTDLNDARMAAIKAAQQNPNDGGSSNFDKACLNLGRVDGAKVQETFQLAGLQGHFRNNWGWLLVPPAGGQGFKSTLQAETMQKLLKERGWNADVYYQVD
jgi:hypothetical protein